MSAVKFTTDQKNAIDSRDSALIVSAAAGSGKTAVLVERVMQHICNEQDTVNISDLIIVTYTEAAAREMRQKITAELMKRLSIEPNNRHLRKQLSLIGGANIQTVHSFCSHLLREHFTECGISPDFKMMDESERAILQREVLDDYLEEKYRHFEDDLDFKVLFENYSDDRGDSMLTNTILELYNKLLSHPEPKNWCKYVSEISEARDGFSPDNTAWGIELIKNSKNMHEFSTLQIKNAYTQMQDVPEVFSKYSEAYDYILNYAVELDDSLEIGWDSAFEKLREFEKPRFKQCRYEDKSFTKQLSDVRDKYSKAIETIRDKYICQSSKNIVKEMSFTSPIIKAICNILIDFFDLFGEAKKKQNMLDFSDLEHMALRLLSDGENKEKSPIAQKVANNTFEILVDEYQDTNEIQERIFKSICPKNKNIFFVGDVKQSIYKFRLANPEIFIDKYLSFAPYAEAKVGEDRKISLNENFRSRKEVLDAVNYVFSRIMTREFGNIDYTDTEALHFGAKYTGECVSELYCLDTGGSSDDENSPQKAQIEANFVANRISELLNTFDVTDVKTQKKRRAQPRDFAILLSSFSNKAGFYERSLSKLGIKTTFQKSGNFLTSTEISYILAFLSVIDNPMQDVPLIALMRSPFYLFSADDILEIRYFDTQRSMYYALSAAAQAGHEKAEKLMSEIAVYRDAAKAMTVSELIEKIYADKNAIAVFSAFDNGAQRKDNLMFLRDIALSYESVSSRGLFRFLSYVKNKYGDGESVKSSSSVDAVQIMSIHKSKGLEYPIVFLPDLAKTFNTDDLKKAILFHEHMGIGVKYRNFNTMTAHKSQMYNAISNKIKRELAAEEMRKLYVAMTRAKEKLIMICAFDNVESRLNTIAENICGSGFSPEAIQSTPNFASWVCAAYLTHPKATELRKFCAQNIELDNCATNFLEAKIVYSSDIVLGEKISEQCESDDIEPMSINPSINLKYIHSKLSGIPSKLSPSGIREFLNTADQKPYVRETRVKNEVALMRGTAVHRLMEHIDLAKCGSIQGVNDELLRLISSGILTTEQSKYISVEQILAMFKTEIGTVLSKAKRVIRESQFSVLFTPNELFKNGISEDNVIVNGIIDMLIFTAEGMVIVDYKTDFVAAGEENVRAGEHSLQIGVYAAAAQKIYAQPVVGKYVYYFKTGVAVNLP